MEKIYYIEKNGHRRTGVKVNCIFCEKEFVTRADIPGKFCSHICCSKNRVRQEILECANCKSKFTRKPSYKLNSKSGLYFCSRKCKDLAQKIGGIQEIMPPHYGTSDKKYRQIYVENFDLYCRRCGYNEFECGIDIHHIDKNRENNDLNNLIALCHPCHKALHLNFWSIDELKE